MSDTSACHSGDDEAGACSVSDPTPFSVSRVPALAILCLFSVLVPDSVSEAKLMPVLGYIAEIANDLNPRAKFLIALLRLMRRLVPAYSARCRECSAKLAVGLPLAPFALINERPDVTIYRSTTGKERCFQIGGSMPSSMIDAAIFKQFGKRVWPYEGSLRLRKAAHRMR